ncbi:hypothetical protein [Lactobacillus crispatus]|jgi:hypothetical protein|uniref:Uncharacterized protein n=1 Tax=Lactobacillus crispatus TaxID=47770 RepID=A0ABV2B7M5_9LACO|nr:hypothetical protein [Lactobacillus crispatus]EEX28269.1 hypothetical protein HMPREF0508_02292 [Lactobacillus crispatus MV-3A-US]KWU05940.1 hypothetical protein AEL96_06235 [Lactobacillus crispatus]KWU09650.1 hypothetical protein AEL97_08005 [Lactobacillus crispatus]KXI20551.1 hypothetical protein HMPREF3209_00443 [Lactobacillus crispatus]MCT7711347.1 hypothetical protein [Lactobacillus crispatus]
MAELNESTFWISGIINGEYRECDGPYTTTKDMSDKGYPYVTKTPNPNFTHQRYDYTAHEWVDTSDDALLHTVEDVKEAVTELKSNSQSNTQSNDQLDKKLDKLTTLVIMSNVQVGEIRKELQAVKTQNQSAAATQPTEPTQNTTPAIEGGNK